MGQKLLTVAEYAEKMKIPAITVYKRIESGKIKASKKWGRLLIADKK